MAISTPQSEVFWQNAEAALEDGSFEDVLKVLIMKLSELSVFSAETAEEARRVNHPLSVAYIRPRSQEARDRAWDNLAARILELGSLLPPEVADGAFLADRVQMEVLLEMDRSFQAARIVEAVNREGDIFEGLGQSQEFFRRVYNPQSVPARPSASNPETAGVLPKTTLQSETPRTEEDSAASDWDHYRAIEKQFYRDAIFGSRSWVT